MECRPQADKLARATAWIALMLAFSIHVAAQDAFQLLHSFTFGVDGAHPSAALAVNAEGSVVYGTAQDGGSFDHGNVFRLVRTTEGWRGAVLHSFGQGNDGWYPQAGVVFDKNGNMYGTTSEGGPYGWGTVFEMSPGAGGSWTETILHGFTFYSEDTPIAPLAFDRLGNLYGTTEFGSLGSWGTVFQMSPPSAPDGQWTETVIYNFTDTNDGAFPSSALLIDKRDNLYGTSYFAGIHDNGTVYELRHTPIGWQENTLYEFMGGDDGGHPSGPLVTDGKGNLYSTAEQDGAGNCGVVFKLSYSQGSWIESTPYSFQCGADGAYPWGGVTFDRFGNLYGTTTQGGTYGYGTVFKLIPNSDGTWNETVLYSFTNGQDGAYPGQGVVPDRLGRLYGVATGGAPPCSCGTVFELLPPTFALTAR